MSAYEPFAADYDTWAADMTEDVAWYIELAREAAEPIVELAVGSGRVAIEIARATGKRVIGIDRSPAMLTVARERSRGLPLEVREGDMRDFELEQQVELVICPFRSMLHLPTWYDKRRVFERVARALRPGGRFAWNAFAFSPLIAASEWEGLIDVAGLEVEALYGGFGREPFVDESLEFVWVARKPTGAGSTEPA
jgi:SAM-dependent methyltransferase